MEIEHKEVQIDLNPAKLDLLIKEEEFPVPVEEDQEELPERDADSLPLLDNISLYIKEISKYRILEKDEVIELAKAYEKGRKAKKQLKTLISDKEERLNLKKIVEEGWDARQKLIKHNLKLVVNIAKKMSGLTLEDRIQAGNFGLFRTVEKFDYRRGNRFSTYAYRWIKQTIKIAVAYEDREWPIYLFDTVIKLNNKVRILRQKLKREPDKEEIAKAMDLSIKKIEELLEVQKYNFSLEDPIGTEEDSELGAFIEDKNAVKPPEKAEHEMQRAKVSEILKELPPREEKIMRLKYGFVDGKAHDMENIGNKLGVTRERIRQIEAEIINKLRSPAYLLRFKQLRDQIS